MVNQDRSPRECLCEQCWQSPQGDVARSHRAINRVLALLDERRRRLFVGLLASQQGHGGVAQLARITGLSRTTIRRGLLELRDGADDFSARVRRPGGGRHRIEKKVPTY
jgi:hypothetical protein